MPPKTRSQTSEKVVSKDENVIEKKQPKKRGSPKEKVVNDDAEPKPEKLSKIEKPETTNKKIAKGKKKVKEVADSSTDIEKEIIETKEQSPDSSSTIYEFTVKDIDGNDLTLEKYKGHVCLIVNVASACGHTKVNYEQLVELHKQYAESKGLRILAFPCNQFGSQEKGTNEKIKEFAKKKGVEFDMFAKIDVKGKNADPLYTFLINTLPKVTSGTETGRDVKWNFTKFIINKEGKPVERYHATTKPLNLVESLEKLF